MLQRPAGVIPIEAAAGAAYAIWGAYEDVRTSALQRWGRLQSILAQLGSPLPSIETNLEYRWAPRGLVLSGDPQESVMTVSGVIGSSDVRLQHEAVALLGLARRGSPLSPQALAVVQAATEAYMVHIRSADGTEVQACLQPPIEQAPEDIRFVANSMGLRQTRQEIIGPAIRQAEQISHAHQLVSSSHPIVAA